MNAYHNLAGFLRDLRAVLTDIRQARTPDNPLSGTYSVQLYDLLAELDEVFDDGESEGIDDESDADDLESADADDGVADAGPGDSGSPGAHGGRLVSRRMRALGRAAGVELPVPHPVSEAELRRESSRATLARTKPRLKSERRGGKRRATTKSKK